MRQDYMPNDDPGKAALFIHVRSNISTFFGALGITPITPQVNTQSNDALAFDYICRAQQTLVSAGQEATSTKNRLRDGDPVNTAPVSLAFPLAPPAVPSPVAPGVVPRFRLFVKWIKALGGYTEAIGEALKIIGEEAPAADLASAKPILGLRLSGGQVQVDWGWEGLRGQVDTLEIHVDRGDGNFVLLTIDPRPGYTDPQPVTANAKWRYKAIWRKNDLRVGQWSDVSEIAVG